MSIQSKDTNIGKVRKYLSKFETGTKFTIRDILEELPEIKGIHVILKTMLVYPEITVAQGEWRNGKVYVLGKLRYEPMPQSVYTAPTPAPLPPFLPGYVILARHTFSQGMGN
ncbi:MAG: hypothetical protein PHP57_13845 [Sideroxydans sp.]|nr:hypothetical protein [Sideroxydans sp.]